MAKCPVCARGLSSTLCSICGGRVYSLNAADYAQLQAAQAERDELQRERDALREALEQVRADYSFNLMDSFVQGRVHRALRASTPSEGDE